MDKLSSSDEKGLVNVLASECLTYLDKHTIAAIHQEVYASSDSAGKFFEILTQTKLASYIPYLMTNCIAFSDGSNRWCDTSHKKFKVTDKSTAEDAIKDMFFSCTTNKTEAKIYIDKNEFECTPYNADIKMDNVSDYAKLIYVQYQPFSSDEVVIQHAALHVPDVGFVSKCGGGDLLLHEALDLANSHNASNNSTYLHSTYGDPLYLCQFTSKNVTDHHNDLNKVFCDTFPEHESCSHAAWWDYLPSFQIAGFATAFALGFATEYLLDWGHHLHVE